MATITAAGVGSGLDIASIVNQLVAAERSPTATRISTSRSTYNTQLSALGSLKSALSTVQDKLQALLDGDALGALKTQSSLSDSFTASASSGAVPGSYDVEVVAIAQAHKLISDPYLDGAGTVLGNGDVTISVGGESFTVSLTDEGNTLADLRDAINKASDNTGVSASLINEANGTRLLLTSNDTGSEHEINVTTSLLTLTEKQPATDAHIRLEGYDIYSSSNAISDAIDGVTINLLAGSEGETGTLTISRDSTTGKKAIEDFVKAYNSLVTLIGTQTKYNADTNKASTFTGDAAVRGVAQSLRGILGGAVSGGTLTALSELGITTKTDGTLEIDSSKLGEVLSANPQAVQNLLAGDDGIATRLDSTIEKLLDDSGVLDAKNDAISAKLKDLDRQQDALDRRIDSLQESYTARFSALDALIAQMNATSDFLTQQLSSLSNLSG